MKKFTEFPVLKKEIITGKTIEELTKALVNHEVTYEQIPTDQLQDVINGLISKIQNGIDYRNF